MNTERQAAQLLLKQLMRKRWKLAGTYVNDDAQPQHVRAGWERVREACIRQYLKCREALYQQGVN